MSDRSTVNLPDGWNPVRLGDFGKWLGGGTPRKSNQLYWTDGEIPWLSPKDMGELVLRGTQDRITKEAVDRSTTKIVKAPSVAVVVRSGILERTLPVSFISFDTSLNQDMKALEPNKDVLPKWVTYGMKAFEQEILATCRKAGTTVASIELPRLMDFVILVPPLAEQEKIVEILEGQLSRLDAALASMRTVRDRAAQFRRSLLHAAFTGALTGDEAFAGALPSGWQARPLGDVADVGWGDLQTTKASYIDEGFIAYSATGADGFLPKFDYDEDGIVLSAIGAACGKTWFATGKWSCIKNTMRILKRSDDVLFHFLALQLSDPRIWPKRGTGQPFIGQKDAREMPISVPPLAEQEKIVEILEEQLSRLDASLVAAHDVERLAVVLRRSLLHAAFTGKLTEQWRKGSHV